MPKRRADTPSQYRILVVGDSAVGKTSLIARYVRNEFPCYTRSHINSDGSTIYRTTIDDRECILTFIDVSSSTDISQLKLSRSIPTTCLIIFSICDGRTFEKISYFQQSIDYLFSNQVTSIPVLLIANKTDFEHDRVVSKQSIKKLKFNSNHVFETSAKTNQGIDDAIYTAVKLLQNDSIEKQSFFCIII